MAKAELYKIVDFHKTGPNGGIWRESEPLYFEDLKRFEKAWKVKVSWESKYTTRSAALNGAGSFPNGLVAWQLQNGEWIAMKTWGILPETK